MLSSITKCLFKFFLALIINLLELTSSQLSNIRMTGESVFKFFLHYFSFHIPVRAVDKQKLALLICLDFACWNLASWKQLRASSGIL